MRGEIWGDTGEICEIWTHLGFIDDDAPPSEGEQRREHPRRRMLT